MIFKLAFNQEIHLLKTNNPSLQEIKQQITKVYPQVPPNYNLSYTDNDGDSITISSEEDLKVLIEEAKQSTLKLYITDSGRWTCEVCTFENINGHICGACETPRQQFQQFIPPPPPPQYPYPPPQVPPYPQAPPFQQPQPLPQGPPPFGPPPFGPPFEFCQGPPPGYYNPYVRGPVNNFGARQVFGGHGHPRYQWQQRKCARMRQIMNDPKFKQQKIKLQQILQETTQAFGTNQRQQQMTQEDQQRIVKLAEVLECSQDQAREYILLFRELTLDEIIMMIQNEE